jgi:hypothetical protein
MWLIIHLLFAFAVPDSMDQSAMSSLGGIPSRNEPEASLLRKGKENPFRLMPADLATLQEAEANNASYLDGCTVRFWSINKRRPVTQNQNPYPFIM